MLRDSNLFRKQPSVSQFVKPKMKKSVYHKVMIISLIENKDYGNRDFSYTFLVKRSSNCKNMLVL